MSPLRCHLLIGAPASGKSTFARELAELVQAPDGQQGLVLSTDEIRRDLFSDATVQGRWDVVREELQARLQEAVAGEVPVIIDATNAYRPWRLAITQAMELPTPVEWVGWWLTTPLQTCLDWNRSSNRSQVPEEIIRRYHQALADADFGPSDHEGFAALLALNPSSSSRDSLKSQLRTKLRSLPKQISGSRNKTANYELHRYSHLLDLERLFYLIRLLSRFPGLEAADERSAQELRSFCSTSPLSEDPAARAAALLRHHGDCYADVERLREDLAWLEQQGFMESMSVRTEVIPPAPDQRVMECLGCRPPAANRKVFVRMMTLIRHVLQNPLDHDRDAAHSDRIHQAGNREGIESIRMPLSVHLVQQLNGIPGGYEAGRILRGRDGRWSSGDSQTLLKDLEEIKRYGLFQAQPARKGYALGTALLTMPRLLELHALVKQVADRLEDPSAQDLLSDFRTRLQWAGQEVDETITVRAYANRPIVGRDYAPPASLAVAQHAERLEEAILKGYPVELQESEDAALFDGQVQNVNTFTVWPLQLLFHNIGWYLAFEEWWPDGSQGLIRTQRLDRLRLHRVVSQGSSRSPGQHRESVKRLDCLLEYCGGIFFGYDRQAQFDLCSDELETRQQQLTLLRFRCMDWAFRFLREGAQRFPKECTRFSRHLPTDIWRHRPKINATLDPIPGDTHPYPVEFDLPKWTIGSGLKDGDVDLKRWLFGFDDGIVIEEPQAFLDRRLWSAQEVLRVHGVSNPLSSRD